MKKQNCAKNKTSSGIAEFLSIVFVIYFVQKTKMGSVFAIYCHRILESACSASEIFSSPINRTGAEEKIHVPVQEKGSLGLVVSSK